MNAALAKFGAEQGLLQHSTPHATKTTGSAPVELPDWSSQWQTLVGQIAEEDIQDLDERTGLSIELLRTEHEHGRLGIVDSPQRGPSLAFPVHDARGVVVGCTYAVNEGEWCHAPAGSEAGVLADGNPNAPKAIVFGNPWDRLNMINSIGESNWFNVLNKQYITIVVCGTAGAEMVGHHTRNCKLVHLWSPTVAGDEWIQQIAAHVPGNIHVRRVQIPQSYRDLAEWSRDARPDLEQVVTALNKGQSIDRTTLDIRRTGIEPPISLMDIATGPADPGKNLLGNRFLCKGGGMLFVGPSGIGKSSASAQQDILWGIGREAFGIKPSRPLKILTIQAENDDEDLAEMRDGVIKGLKLSSEDIAKVRENVFYDTVSDLTGDEFMDYLENKLKTKQYDIVRVDHLTAYLGGDVSNPMFTTPFLRGRLNPLLKKYGVACIINHHTPKTTNRDTKRWKDSDWMYAGAGAADVTNWARAILVIDPTHTSRVFKFIAAKRGSRIGWRDKDDAVETTRYFCHGLAGIYWREPTQEDFIEVEAAAEAVKKNGKKPRDPEDLLALIPMEGAIPKKKLLLDATARKLGRDWTDAMLKQMIEDGELHIWKIRRSGTNAEIQISRHPQITT